jgi:hypothetical protein
MNWTDLIKGELENTYRAADQLLAMVDDDKLGWKPATGSNWMTTGQLIQHMSDACGAPCRGFVTGEWGFPEGVDPSTLPEDAMLPPAEKMPAAENVAQARRLLQADKRLALEMLARAGEDDLNQKSVPAPWDPRPLSLGLRLLQMVAHLNQHKGQLYYYLKLQGKPVNTMHLWGM